MPAGIPYEEARKRYRPGVAPAVRGDDISVEELLKAYHPDHRPNARVALTVGVNCGEPCQPDLARYLQANALIDDVDIAGAQLVSTDVLIIGGGGWWLRGSADRGQARRAGDSSHQAAPR